MAGSAYGMVIGLIDAVAYIMESEFARHIGTTEPNRTHELYMDNTSIALNRPSYLCDDISVQMKAVLTLKFCIYRPLGHS